MLLPLMLTFRALIFDECDRDPNSELPVGTFEVHFGPKKSSFTTTFEDTRSFYSGLGDFCTRKYFQIRNIG